MILSPPPVSVASDPGSPTVVSVDEVAEAREVVRSARRESVGPLVCLVERGVWCDEVEWICAESRRVKGREDRQR